MYFWSTPIWGWKWQFWYNRNFEQNNNLNVRISAHIYICILLPHPLWNWRWVGANLIDYDEHKMTQWPHWNLIAVFALTCYNSYYLGSVCNPVHWERSSSNLAMIRQHKFELFSNRINLPIAHLKSFLNYLGKHCAHEVCRNVLIGIRRFATIVCH